MGACAQQQSRLQVHKAELRHSMHGIREVAVKVQYPGALQVMLQDLKNIRRASRPSQQAASLHPGSPQLLIMTAS